MDTNITHAHLIYGSFGVTLKLSCLLKTRFFSAMLRNISKSMTCMLNSKTLELDLKPLDTLDLYIDDLEWFFGALQYDYQITLANTEFNIYRATLVEYFQVKEQYYIYCWYEHRSVSYSHIFNYDAFCESVEDMIPQLDKDLTRTDYCAFFTIPERCTILTLGNTSVGIVEGSATIIDLAYCKNIHGAFVIPKQCVEISLSDTNITSISGTAPKIDVSFCKKLPPDFRKPEGCIDFNTYKSGIVTHVDRHNVDNSRRNNTMKNKAIIASHESLLGNCSGMFDSRLGAWM